MSVDKLTSRLTTQATGSNRSLALPLISLGLFLMLLAPLFLVSVPPLLDYPNHLARSFITMRIDEDPDLARIYQIHWRPVPNLGSDILIYVLVQVMSLTAAGKTFIATVIASTLVGTATLHRVLFGRWSFWPLISALFAYNGLLLAGFISYALGVGLMLLGVAAWVALRDAPLVVRVLAGMVIGTALYFCHLTALGGFGFAVGGYELWRLFGTTPPSRRVNVLVTDAIVLAAPFVLPVLMYLPVLAGGSDQSVGLSSAWDLVGRLRGPFLPAWNYVPWLDVATLLLFVGIVGGLAVTRRLRVAAGMVPGMLLLLIPYLALPGHFLDASYVPDRFPIMVLFLAIAATRPVLNRSPAALGLGTVVAVLLIARTVVLSENWREHDRYMTGMHAAAQHIEHGSTVLVTYPFREPRDLFREQGWNVPSWYYALGNVTNLTQMPSVLVMDRSVFLHLLFNDPRKQILSIRPDYQPLDKPDGDPLTVREVLPPDGGPPATAKLAQVVPGYDYILVLYAEFLKPDERQRLSQLHPLYDDGRIMLAVNPLGPHGALQSLR
jgi:hypothetical protein